MVCTYEYDAWGNCTVYGSSGSINTSSTFIGNINPIRYRGYYYDAETSLYYVSSRYYEPEFGRFLNSDTSDVITASVGNPGYDKNLYAYCDNNPVIRIDVTGYIWETVFDIASLGVSVVEVAINPSDPWAWAGLVGDAIDLIPFVTGVGETTKAVRLVKHTDNILDTFKATKKSAKSSVGVYEITYKSGKNYVGKGSIGRAAQSAKRYSRPNVMNNMRGDTITSIRWKASSSSRNAFIEKFALQTQKGVGNKYTYNKIWSPGRKYYTAMGGKLR